MIINKLTDSAIRSAIRKALAASKAGKPGKALKLYDGAGLFLLLTPQGSPLWRFKYSHEDLEKLISFGSFPDVGLALARERREAARKLVADGVDPSAQRKAQKAARRARSAHSFEVLALEWLEKRSAKWAPANAARIAARVKNDLIRWIGDRSMYELQDNAPLILETVQRIEKRKAVDTAHRVLQDAGRIFRYAIATNRAKHDPTAHLRGGLIPVKGGNFPAITDPVGVGELLRAVRGYHGTTVVAAALNLLPYLFVRPNELRYAEWCDFDLDSEHPQWNIPAARMKMKRDHIVPLAPPVVQILRDLKPITGDGRLLFPSLRSAARPISDGALCAALRNLGYTGEQMVAHSFRAIARTLLDEHLGFRTEWIELQLAHEVKDANGTAYNRTSFLEGRRQMMRTWATFLDGLREGERQKLAA
jgi:integrase